MQLTHPKIATNRDPRSRIEVTVGFDVPPHKHATKKKIFAVTRQGTKEGIEGWMGVEINKFPHCVAAPSLLFSSPPQFVSKVSLFTLNLSLIDGAI